MWEVAHISPYFQKLVSAAIENGSDGDKFFICFPQKGVASNSDTLSLLGGSQKFHIKFLPLALPAW